MSARHHQPKKRPARRNSIRKRRKYKWWTLIFILGIELPQIIAAYLTIMQLHG